MKNFLIKNKKYVIIGGAIIVLGGLIFIPPAFDFGADEPLVIEVSPALNWTKPTTDKEWDEDLKKSGTSSMFDHQLDLVEAGMTEKIPKLQKDLDKYITCPECIKYELRERFIQMFKDSGIALDKKLEGKTLQEWIDREFAEDLANKQLSLDMAIQYLERVIEEKELRKDGKVDRTTELINITPSTEKEKEIIQELKTLKGIQ